MVQKQVFQAWFGDVHVTQVSALWVMEEFKNSDTNHLGIALPKGKLRFYRRDTDGHLEFVGENMIDHTPKDETIRVYTGNAFDVVACPVLMVSSMTTKGSAATLE